MKSSSFICRVLLLALLPCIAAILYVRGQHYDSALIDFKTAAETSAAPALSAEKTPSAPPMVQTIAGYRPLAGAHRYTKDNLYEHVDGHAEYFIGAGFVGLTVTDYGAAASKTAQAELSAEVFDMGKPIQAFGVLADESGENPQAVSVGAMGYKTSGGVNFIKGRYYVKVSSFNAKAPVLEFARALSGTLPAGQDSFKVFSKFPILGKVEKTRFVKEGYRGLDFLRNVIEREYSAAGRKITVALVADTTPEVKTLQASFMDYFRKSGMRYERIEKYGNEAYKVADKYEGDWLLVPKGNTMFMVFGTDDEEILKHFNR